MPPDLWDVLDRCPAMRSWKAKKRPIEPDLAGLRDQALLLVGFVALRRSELAALTIDAIAEHPNGLVLIQDEPDGVSRSSYATSPLI